MPTVLIVDDTMFMRVTIANMLKEWGFKVVGEAANGRQAVDMYHALQPDIVTMDVTMPIMNGIEAVKEIMVDDPEAKIIMITALGKQSLVVEAISYGAKDFVTKPFTKEKLKLVVDNIL